jgi:hypothetical protein
VWDRHGHGRGQHGHVGGLADGAGWHNGGPWTSVEWWWWWWWCVCVCVCVCVFVPVCVSLCVCSARWRSATNTLFAGSSSSSSDSSSRRLCRLRRHQHRRRSISISISVRIRMSISNSTTERTTHCELLGCQLDRRGLAVTHAFHVDSTLHDAIANTDSNTGLQLSVRTRHTYFAHTQTTCLQHGWRGSNNTRKADRQRVVVGVCDGTGWRETLRAKSKSCNDVTEQVVTYIQTYIQSYIHKIIHTYIHTYIRTYIKTHTYIHACACVRTHIHT